MTAIDAGIAAFTLWPDSLSALAGKAWRLVNAAQQAGIRWAHWIGELEADTI
jgi:hypothetical protein